MPCPSAGSKQFWTSPYCFGQVQKDFQFGQNVEFDSEIIALSFYRSQNVLGWSKFFESNQKFTYILCRSQTFCARPREDFYLLNSFFVPAQIFWSCPKCNSIYGLAQEIWTSAKKIWDL